MAQQKVLLTINSLLFQRLPSLPMYPFLLLVVMTWAGLVPAMSLVIAGKYKAEEKQQASPPRQQTSSLLSHSRLYKRAASQLMTIKQDDANFKFYYHHKLSNVMRYTLRWYDKKLRKDTYISSRVMVNAEVTRIKDKIDYIINHDMNKRSNYHYFWIYVQFR